MALPLYAPRLLQRHTSGANIKSIGMIRVKHPHADLRRTYAHRMGMCMGLALMLLIMATWALPGLPARQNATHTHVQTLLHIEHIPPTRQMHRPPPVARPAVPIQAEFVAVPVEADFTTADLDFDPVSTDLRAALAALAPSEPVIVEEEIFDYQDVQQKPVLRNALRLEYPQAALRSRREDTVYVRFIVDHHGRVHTPEIVQGHAIFERAALDAVSDLVFEPAHQNGQPVRVRMLLPIEFRLTRN